jgi:hypothetical protein
LIYVIFYLFLVNIIGNCQENRYIWIYWNKWVLFGKKYFSVNVNIFETCFYCFQGQWIEWDSTNQKSVVWYGWSCQTYT